MSISMSIIFFHFLLYYLLLPPHLSQMPFAKPAMNSDPFQQAHLPSLCIIQLFCKIFQTSLFSLFFFFDSAIVYYSLLLQSVAYVCATRPPHVSCLTFFADDHPLFLVVIFHTNAYVRGKVGRVEWQINVCNLWNEVSQ